MDAEANGVTAGPLRQERMCQDCHGIEFVEDHARGDIVCKVGTASLQQLLSHRLSAVPGT